MQYVEENRHTALVLGSAQHEGLAHVRVVSSPISNIDESNIMPMLGLQLRVSSLSFGPRTVHLVLARGTAMADEPSHRCLLRANTK